MVGTTVLHYEVLRELGEGGMGRVYLARDRRTERLVALKFLAAEADADPQSRDRLIREARASARLAHSGVVTLFGVEEAEGRTFLVEEYVEGETLAERLARGPLGSQETWRLARELTAALAHAHRQGILHRDLKPANILIAPDGSFKIADFGIARIDGSPALTRTGAVMGTLGFLAPERIRGNTGDARADLFALGAILYEAIAGRSAFAGTTEAATMHAVLEEEPPRLSPSSALLPLVGVVERLLAKTPADRPASAEEVAALLDCLPTGARPSAATRRHPGRGAALAAATALLLLGGIAAVLFLRGPAGAPDGGRAEPTIAVLYFENVADPEDRARMGSISSNLLVTSFAQHPGLNVLGTHRMLEAMGDIGARGVVDRAEAMRVARRARAQRIVTGTILRIDPAIVMTAEVADVATGRLVHAERIEGRPGQTVFDVVDALSARLVPRLTHREGGASYTPAPVARVTSDDLAAQRAYADGLERFAAGEFEAASASLDEAIRLDPSFPQALYHRAIVEWWLREPASAVASVEAARAQSARLSPRERAVLEGVSHLIAARWSEARKVFERLAREAPDEKLAFYGIVEAGYHGGEDRVAVDAARQALELDPGFDLVNIHLVDALQALGQLDEAERVAVESLRRHPGNVPLWFSLFHLRAKRGDGAGALAAARSASGAGADSTELPALALLLAVNLGRVDDAGVWATAEKLDGGPVPGDSRLGLEYTQAMRGGRFREAMSIAERAWRAMRADLDLPWPTIPLAEGSEAAAAFGDARRALAWTDSSTARVQRWSGVTGSREGEAARLYLMVRLGQVDEVRARIKRMSAQAPTAVDRQWFRFIEAAIHERRGEPARALELLVGSKPTGWPPLGPALLRLHRGRLELALGRPTAALATFDTLLKAPLMEPHDAARLHLDRARALERLGRPGQAATAYREFLELWKDADPGRPEVTEARAALTRLTS